MINGNQHFFLDKNSSHMRRVYYVPDITLSTLCVWAHFLEFIIKTKIWKCFWKVFSFWKICKIFQCLKMFTLPVSTLRNLNVKQPVQMGPEVHGASSHSPDQEAESQRGKGLVQGLASQGPKRDQYPGVLAPSPGSFHHALCKENTEKNKNHPKFHHPEISIAKILEYLSSLFSINIYTLNSLK